MSKEYLDYITWNPTEGVGVLCEYPDDDTPVVYTVKNRKDAERVFEMLKSSGEFSPKPIKIIENI